MHCMYNVRILYECVPIEQFYFIYLSLFNDVPTLYYGISAEPCQTIQRPPSLQFRPQVAY